MSQYTNYDLAQALDAVSNGQSVNKAAALGVFRRPQLNGRESRKDAFQAYQRLSSVQEHHSTQWILTQDVLGFPQHICKSSNLLNVSFMLKATKNHWENVG